VSEYSEVIETRGDYRVRIEIDPGPSEPEGDCEAPLLRVEIGSASSVDSRAKFADDRVRAAFGYWCRRPGDEGWRFFVKYVCAFFGATSVQSWLSENENYYVAWDTPEYREYSGAPADLSDADLVGAEWKAYTNGDVWDVVVEKRVTWTTDDEYDDRDTWEDAGELAASGGYYGRDWAEQAAREHLDEWAPGVPA
jgi:hypothetical protein